MTVCGDTNRTWDETRISENGRKIYFFKQICEYKFANSICGR